MSTLSLLPERWVPALRLAPWAILSALLLLTGGCHTGKKSRVSVVHYPSFYRPEIKRVAVLPFEDRVETAGAAARIGERLETALVRNGTYEVYTRQHLADVLAELDLAVSGIVEPEAAQRIGRLKSVDILIAGVCNQYVCASNSEIRTRQVPIYGTNAKGKRVITGYRNENYTWTMNGAVVQCTVNVIDTATGQVVASVNEPSQKGSQGSPPRYTQWQLLQAAENDQLAKILLNTAVLTLQVKLRGTVLQVASGRYDGKWDRQSRFTPSDERLYAVVRLPAAAGRNTFRITIVPKDGRQVLAEQEFVWPEHTTENSFVFDIGRIAEKNGPGAYQARIYSGPEPFAWTNFQIVAKP